MTHEYVHHDSNVIGIHIVVTSTIFAQIIYLVLMKDYKKKWANDSSGYYFTEPVPIM